MAYRTPFLTFPRTNMNDSREANFARRTFVLFSTFWCALVFANYDGLPRLYTHGAVMGSTAAVPDSQIHGTQGSAVAKPKEMLCTHRTKYSASACRALKRLMKRRGKRAPAWTRGLMSTPFPPCTYMNDMARTSECAVNELNRPISTTRSTPLLRPVLLAPQSPNRTGPVSTY